MSNLMQAIASKIISPIARASEGFFRQGPYRLSGGTLSAEAGQFFNWWQLGYGL